MRRIQKVIRNNELLTSVRELGRPPLKAVAQAVGVSDYHIKKASRLEGGRLSDSLEDMYDWVKLEEFLRLRLDPDKGLPTIRAVVVKALELSERRGHPNKKSFHENIDGELVAMRKYQNCDMEYVNTGFHPKQIPIVLLKNDLTVYTIVYQTKTYTVLQSVNVDGEPDSEELKCLTNSRINYLAVPYEQLSMKKVLQQYEDKKRGASA